MSLNISEKPHGDLNLGSDSIEKALASVEEALMSVKEALGTAENSCIIKGNGISPFCDQADEISFKPTSQLSDMSADSIERRVNQGRVPTEDLLQKGQQDLTGDFDSGGETIHETVSKVVTEEQSYNESRDKGMKVESVDKGMEEESADKREAEERKDGIIGQGDVQLASGTEGVSAIERISDEDFLMLESAFELTKSSIQEMQAGAETVEVNKDGQSKNAGWSSNNVNDIITKDNPEDGLGNDSEQRDMAEEAKQEETEKMDVGNEGNDATESNTCPTSSSTSSDSSPPATAETKKTAMSQSLTNRKDPTRSVTGTSSGWKNPDDDYEDNEEEKAFRRRIEREDLIIEHVAIAVCVALAAFLIYVMFIR